VGSLYRSLLTFFLRLCKYLGAAYILYLAYRVLHADYTLSQKGSKLLDYKDGLLLQLFNPKVLVLALTLYTTFLSSMNHSVPALFLSALFFTMMSFSAISLWAFSGTTFSHVLASQKAKRVVNSSLALLLVFSAVTLIIV
jgi:cysteine/O-acetylserine efflux protein